jgi:hypothetical protein
MHGDQRDDLGEGWGLLQDCTATVTAQTRRAPLASSVQVRLPGSHGAIEAVETAPATITELPMRFAPLAVAG